MTFYDDDVLMVAVYTVSIGRIGSIVSILYGQGSVEPTQIDEKAAVLRVPRSVTNITQGPVPLFTHPRGKRLAKKPVKI